MLFLCNPNNPTGQALSLDVLDAWARAHPDTLFVVDEAYLAFAPGMKSATTLRHKNILILCSMTKDYAIAGIRLGYALADESIIQALVNVRPAWNVSALAQSAGLVALQDEAHQHETLTQLQQEKHFLISGLQELGFIPVPSHTHYFLMPVHNGTEFRQALLKHGILVRDCASFGLPGYIRISAQTREQNIRLLKALKAMIE
jgi:histidinol-phosphate/aromatic aminotransferase/cobyric acid decarboxylase-like protein